MSYLVFARKFRPQCFEDVLGQEHVTRTLSNAIARQRIPQNFLFTGMRGVGKTTTARVLAKALNCEKGPVAQPCGICLSCTEITQGRSLDVLEIDGASNRGIDEVRELRENVKFKPAAARFKIYIIDEVHQITHDAFNALLKTLEEPPPHVKFIFATTEPAKVPATITSRCQRFHFRSLSVSEIVGKLKRIVSEEKLAADEEALYALARVAEGSVRDAESLLDQVMSFGEGCLKVSDVVEVLGLAPDQLVAKFVAAIGEQDAKEGVILLDGAVREGFEVSRVIRRLTEYFRDILVLKACGKESGVLEASPEKLEEMAALSGRFTREDAGVVLSMLFKLENDVARSATPRITAEAGLIRIASRASLSSIEAILEELKKAEKSPDSAARERMQAAAPSARLESARRAPSDAMHTTDSVRKEGRGSSVSAPGRAGQSESGGPGAREASAGGQARHKEGGQATAVSDEPAKGADVRPSRAIQLAEAEAVWPSVLALVKQKKMSTGIFLSEAEPAETDDNVVVVGVPSEFRFHKETLERTENRRLIEEAFSTLLDARVGVKFVVTQAEQVESGRDELSAEVVDAALRIFEGKILKKE